MPIKRLEHYNFHQNYAKYKISITNVCVLQQTLFRTSIFHIKRLKIRKKKWKYLIRLRSFLNRKLSPEEVWLKRTKKLLGG